MKIRLNPLDVNEAEKHHIEMLDGAPVLRFGLCGNIEEFHFEDDVMVIDKLELLSVDLSRDWFHYES